MCVCVCVFILYYFGYPFPIIDNHKWWYWSSIPEKWPFDITFILLILLPLQPLLCWCKYYPHWYLPLSSSSWWLTMLLNDFLVHLFSCWMLIDKWMFFFWITGKTKCQTRIDIIFVFSLFFIEFIFFHILRYYYSKQWEKMNDQIFREMKVEKNLSIDCLKSHYFIYPPIGKCDGYFLNTKHHISMILFHFD